ncbi:MAG: TetR/AcrR family transcriptional regulator [Solirubrobacteraceae bacterium]
MPTTTQPAPSGRLTAAERRSDLVAAAISEFAAAGLAGASTEAIARRAGISHAYLFRLFGTKRDLFLAAVDASFGHVLATFKRAEERRGPREPFQQALGHSYTALIEDRKELLFAFHAYAACGDEDIRAVVEARYMEIFEWVRRTGDLTVDETRLFMSAGLLIAVGAAIGNDRLSPDGSWTGRVRRS